MKKIILILIILSTMFMIGCSNEYSSFMNDCLTNKRAEFCNGIGVLKWKIIKKRM